ncbi:aspartate aminotransferase family protein [Priestia aryabhattai]|uniref:acetylornithine transaminase n=1 Tax=Priestia TaxID=2800373 RepID=UPI000BA11019|nr:acetylornithine transaminase [Priestia flexa]MDT2048118.1 acetylornithine transaminase [Priestia flexa]OZT11224.1 aspartate aminotransferase family protein [Priestia aryabhattai]
MSSLFPTYQRLDIHVKEANGTYLTDENNQTYLDFISGIAVCNVGHRHPEVQKAVEEQLNKVWHVSNLFHQSIQEEVANLLVANSSGDAVFFCNSGAEANEAAIKLARKHTKKHKIITFTKSFHGRTFATMTATGQAKIHEGFGPLVNEFVYLPYNDVESLEAEMDDTVAAIMTEVVQGEGGVVPGTESFLTTIQKLCQEYGALFIVDEVQTGIGRTGKPFAYQHFNLSPDIITAAKGLGSGMPIGAMIGKGLLKESFGPGTHGTTFGGNPIALASAKATLQIIFNQQFLEEVNAKSATFKKQLTVMLESYSIVKEVRAKGFMIGIECGKYQAQLITAMREKGLLVLGAGPHVIRLLPPLTVSSEELSEALTVIEQVFQELKITI